jgi:hypothetical protein
LMSLLTGSGKMQEEIQLASQFFNLYSLCPRGLFSVGCPVHQHHLGSDPSVIEFALEVVCSKSSPSGPCARRLVFSPCNIAALTQTNNSKGVSTQNF